MAAALPVVFEAVATNKDPLITPNVSVMLADPAAGWEFATTFTKIVPASSSPANILVLVGRVARVVEATDKLIVKVPAVLGAVQIAAIAVPAAIAAAGRR